MTRLLQALGIAGLIAGVFYALGFAPPSIPATTPVRDYQYPLVDAPRDDEVFPCLPTNPTCPPAKPWWVSWPTGEEEREAGLVQFSFLPPGFIAERRFIEPIQLLYQWSEGRTLLAEAGAYGIHIHTVPDTQAPNAIAFFRSSNHEIGMLHKYIEVSIFLQSLVLSHELMHALDAKLAAPSWTLPSCVALEQRAEQTERRFLRWLTTRMGGLPTPEMVQEELSAEDNAVFATAVAVMTDVSSRS